jgi:hypothetical protein
MTELNDEQRLTSYLVADSKYVVVPIPTPIEPGVATQFVNNHTTDRLTPEKMSKLARLVILHDLRDTAPTFMALLKNTERQRADYHRSAWALIALAWIGSQEQRKFSQSYLHQLQARANIWENRLVMLDATEAFGPTEGTESHRSWVAEEIGRLKSLMNQYQVQKKQSESRGIQNQVDELEEHLNIRVAAVDRSNAIRSLVLGLPTDERISRLVALYLGTEPATPALSSWAAFTLARVAKQDANAERMATQCSIVAKQHEGPESERNAQFALVRARSLRAVKFLGQKLSNSDQQWLKTQEDPGTDMLALRPHWIYH